MVLEKMSLIRRRNWYMPSSPSLLLGTCQFRIRREAPSCINLLNCGRNWDEIPLQDGTG